MKTPLAAAGLTALTLLDISAATPVAAQGVPSPFAGGYAGAHTGYATSSTTFTSAPYTVTGLPSDPFAVYPVPGRNDSFDFDGAIVGLHSGYNIVTQGNILFGIEGDWTYLGLRDAVDFNSGFVESDGGDGALFQHRSELELEWQGTIRGRLGFIAGNTLFFATAGVAFIKTEWNETATVTDCGGVCGPGDPTFTRFHNSSDTLTGGVVGGGIEFAFAPDAIFGADYLYENFGDIGLVPFGHTTPAQEGQLGDLEVHKVRVRLSFKLGGPPPQ